MRIPGSTRRVPVVPIQLADEDTYHVSTGPAYFDTRLKLVPLEDNGAGTLVPKEKNGSTLILDPAQVPDYFDNIHSTPGPDSEHPDGSPAYKFVSHVSLAGDAPPARDLTEDFKLWTRDGKS